MGKAFEKQTKTVEDQGQKQVETLKGLKPEAVESESNNTRSISKEIYDKILDERMVEILEMSREINYNNLVYNFKDSSVSPISFTEFGGPMYTYDQLKKSDKTLQQVENEQKKFRSELGPKKSGLNKSENQSNTINNVKNLYNSRQKIIDLVNDNLRIRSESLYKANKKIAGTGLKILPPKQMLQRLPIALAHVKAGNNSESLLNEIRQIVYPLYQSKEITQKAYNNIIKSIQLKTMDTIFMNSENSKTSEPHILILKLTDKLDLRRGEKTIALSNLSIYYTWKNIKGLCNNNKFKTFGLTWNDKFELPDAS